MRLIVNTILLLLNKGGKCKKEREMERMKPNLLCYTSGPKMVVEPCSGRHAGEKLCFSEKPKKFPTFQQHQERLMTRHIHQEHQGGENIIQLACSSCICLFFAFLALFFPPRLFSSRRLSALKEVEIFNLPAPAKSIAALLSREPTQIWGKAQRNRFISPLKPLCCFCTDLNQQGVTFIFIHIIYLIKCQGTIIFNTTIIQLSTYVNKRMLRLEGFYTPESDPVTCNNLQHLSKMEDALFKTASV